MKYKLYSLLLTTLLVSSAFASDSTKLKKHRFLRLNYQVGKVLPTNDFVKGQNNTGKPINTFHSGALELGVKTDGSKQWHHDWSFPIYGFGFYTADFFNDDELGQPAAIYTFLAPPIFRYKSFGLFYELGIGLTFNWKPYDAEINPWNLAIGSYKTVYIDVGLRAQLALGEHWDLSGGSTFTHFSNGASSTPNMGLNMSGGKIALAYNLRKERPGIGERKKAVFDKKHELSYSIKAGSKEVTFDTSITKLKSAYLGIGYGLAGADILYQYHFHPIFKFGAGIDAIYDGSVSAQLDVVDGVYNPVSVPSEYYWNMSVFASVEVKVDRVSLLIQPGWYVLRKKIEGQHPDFYQRLIGRVAVWKGLYVSGALRAYNFGVADYIEWGVGYRHNL